jgi:hypothetical protein
LSTDFDSYAIRDFQEGDEAALLQIFEKAYSNLGGYTHKTPEYWRWCFLQRPDVEKSGIIISVEKSTGVIVGYAVAGKSGNLWELAYDHQKDGKKIVALLLRKAEDYLQGAGASSVNLAAPQMDRVVSKVCRDFGYATTPSPQMFCAVLNYSNLLTSLSNNVLTNLKTKFNDTFLIEIEQAPIWIDHEIFLEVNRNNVRVSCEPCTPTVKLKIDNISFSSILFGNSSPLSAFLKLKLKVKPVSKVLTALSFLSQLQVKDKWSFSLSEYG